jgi:hypothetical protein
MKTKISLFLCVVILSPGISFAESTETAREKHYPLESREQAPAMAAVDISCVKGSVSERETSVAIAFKAFSETMNTLLATRKDSLEQSFSLPTAKERSVARKSARAVFKSASIVAHKTLSVARQEAWTKFRSTAKSCKGGSAEIKDETPSTSRSSTEAL